MQYIWPAIDRLQIVTIVLITVLNFQSAAAVEVVRPVDDAANAYESKNYKLAYEILIKKAAEGNAEAMANLALLYRDGKGVEQSESEWFKWAASAAYGGSAPGQYDMGLAHLAGRVVARNNAVAKQWLKRSAEQGFVLAQYHLSTLYNEEQGAHSKEIAYYWLLLSSLGNYPEAIKYTEIYGQQFNNVHRIRIEGIARSTYDSLSRQGRLPMPSCHIEYGPNFDVDGANKFVERMKAARARGSVWGKEIDGELKTIVKLGPYPSFDAAKRNATYLLGLQLKPIDISCNEIEKTQSETRTAKSVLQALPLARQGGSCPIGYITTQDYCMPANNSRYAIERTGSDSCPIGYSVSGGFCIASSDGARLAVKRISGCPVGYSGNNSYCLKN
jgi:hypothetical protein